MVQSRVRKAVIPRRQIPPEYADRLPRGPVIAKRWAVLHQGEVPAFDPATWDFELAGLVQTPLRLSWGEFCALPQVTVAGDLHCVTRWSVMDRTWTGVPFLTLLDRAGVLDTARFATLIAEGGYTANVPLDALTGPDALLAMASNGQDLAPEHGFPVRALIASRYAWKSVKWIRGIELRADDQPGFWEQYGYSDNADPWREERFRDESE